MSREDLDQDLVDIFWGVVVIVLFVLALALAMSTAGYGQNIEGQPVASQYSTWQVAGYAPDTYSFVPTSCRVQGGASFFAAFTVGTPVRIVDGNPSLSETVTPTNVTINNNTCSIAIAPTHHHNLPFYLTSATGGLQEAINANHANPASNTIVLDNKFYRAVGSSNVAAIIGAAVGFTNLGLVDITQTPYVWYEWNGSHYVVASTGQDVTSVFGRTGAVAAETGDYDCAQVTGCPNSAPVTSVFGRTGAIAAQAGDYNCDQITGCGSAPNIIFGSTLASSITNSVTTIPLATSAAGLAVPGVIIIDGEWIQYAGISGDNLTGAVRGYHQTTAASHSASANVYSIVQDFGSPAQVPFNYVISNGGPETVGAVFGCSGPDPVAGIFAQFGCNGSDTYFDALAGIHQTSGDTENFLDSPTGIGPGGGWAPITNSGYLFDSTRQNNSSVTQGFAAGIAPLVEAVQPPTIDAPAVANFAGTGSTTWSWRCTGTDVDGNTFPGTDTTITNGPATVSSGGFFDITCPFSSGAVTETIWRTAGPGTTGLLLTGSMPAESPDTNSSLSGTPPATNSSVPKACVGGSEVSCWITSASVPTGACINGWFDTNQSGTPSTIYQCVANAWSAVGGTGATLPFPGLVYATSAAGGTVATSAQIATGLTSTPQPIGITTLSFPTSTSPIIIQNSAGILSSYSQSLFMGINSGAIRGITGTSNTCIGYYCLGSANATVSNNTGFGTYALDNLTSGINDTGIGGGALGAVTSGPYNTCIGKDCFESGTTLNHSVGIGEGVGDSAVSSSDLSILGFHTGFNTLSSDVTLLGYEADTSPTMGVNFAGCLGSGCIVNTAYTYALGGHLGSHQLSTAVGVSGTGCTLTYGNDNDGKITLSSGATSCVVTFGHAYSQPVAMLSASTTSVTPVVTTLTTAALTIGVSAASGILYYHVSDVN